MSTILRGPFFELMEKPIYLNGLLWMYEQGQCECVCTVQVCADSVVWYGTPNTITPDRLKAPADSMKEKKVCNFNGKLFHFGRVFFRQIPRPLLHRTMSLVHPCFYQSGIFQWKRSEIYIIFNKSMIHLIMFHCSLFCCLFSDWI